MSNDLSLTPVAKNLVGFHFVGDTLLDGRAIPEDHTWLVHTGELRVCASGYHASLHVKDALDYSPGATLCLVRLRGRMIEMPDKVVASSRKIIARFDASELLHEYARWCALQVAHLWDMPHIVRRYLETGDEAIREDVIPGLDLKTSTHDAANLAAWSAAVNAVRRGGQASCVVNATRTAMAWSTADQCAAKRVWCGRETATAAHEAWEATNAGQRTKLESMVNAKFLAMGFNVPQLQKDNENGYQANTDQSD